MAELKSKYELRSPEVQEVMNKPPHFFISWGNLLITLSILLAMLLINKIQIKNYDRFLATISSNQLIVNENCLVIKLNMDDPKIGYDHGLETQITFLGDKSVDLGSILGTIDSSWCQDQHTYISLKSTLYQTKKLRLDNSRVIEPVAGMNVGLKITTSKENIIESMIRKLIKR
ncbi:hypothetical protein [Sphingobacterium sp. UBA5996]|uniref:hypothetical protein n=1 Tax=Sphingobacterium sp. UBA5996 TaxID=1947505 RepID=UPI002600DFBF|nr:hypothetical protein [Sphingobacterium sp. UBA5996]